MARWFGRSLTPRKPAIIIGGFGLWENDDPYKLTAQIRIVGAPAGINVGQVVDRYYDFVVVGQTSQFMYVFGMTMQFMVAGDKTQASVGKVFKNNASGEHCGYVTSSYYNTATDQTVFNWHWSEEGGAAFGGPYQEEAFDNIDIGSSYYIEFSDSWKTLAELFQN